jgi:uncharacterized SAM-binding protein YcdF (DUF218 family)
VSVSGRDTVSVGSVDWPVARSRWSRRAVPFGLVVLAAFIAVTIVAPRLGTALVVQDALARGRAIAVLGGGLPFRALEAAALYRQGWAPEVWVTRGPMLAGDEALARLAIDRPPDHEYSRRVLVKSAVPADRIHVFDEPTSNTAEEVRSIRRRAAGGRGPIIIVTSAPHTRRLRVLWTMLVGSKPEVIVRYGEREPFDASAWWRHSADAQAVAHEWFGILNAWLGFPVRSGR